MDTCMPVGRARIIDRQFVSNPVRARFVHMCARVGSHPPIVVLTVIRPRLDIICKSSRGFERFCLQELKSPNYWPVITHGKWTCLSPEWLLRMHCNANYPNGLGSACLPRGEHRRKCDSHDTQCLAPRKCDAESNWDSSRRECVLRPRLPG
jgi:hypothetical protein